MGYPVTVRPTPASPPWIAVALASFALGCGWLTPQGAPVVPSPSASDAAAAARDPYTPGAGADPVVRDGVPVDAARCDRGRGAGCFVHLPATEIQQGAQATDPNAPGHDPHARADEAPVRARTVDAFWLQADEVSAGDYAACLDAGWCDPDEVLLDGGLATVRRPGREHLPAVGVSWAGAVRYCAWRGARLPTESEWERAARGAEGRRFAWGDAVRCGQVDAATARAQAAGSSQLVDACGAVMEALRAVLDEAAYLAVTRPLQDKYTPDEVVPYCKDWQGLQGDALVAAVRAVGEAPRREPEPTPCVFDGPAIPADLRDATPEGIRGLGSNVAEWTSDLYVEPEGASGHAPTQRVQRGGSWMMEDPWELRAAARGHLAPEARLPDVGVRCAAP
ncbi:MAG: formylglycine-generating enzyme family protein [Alphaproteobacteria bacterium]|nr:formylglycine-generating enzyme family protein [Alphaproteobacteria bacterium]